MINVNGGAELTRPLGASRVEIWRDVAVKIAPSRNDQLFEAREQSSEANADELPLSLGLIFGFWCCLLGDRLVSVPSPSPSSAGGDEAEWHQRNSWMNLRFLHGTIVSVGSVSCLRTGHSGLRFFFSGGPDAGPGCVDVTVAAADARAAAYEAGILGATPPASSPPENKHSQPFNYKPETMFVSILWPPFINVRRNGTRKDTPGIAKDERGRVAHAAGIKVRERTHREVAGLKRPAPGGRE